MENKIILILTFLLLNSSCMLNGNNNKLENKLGIEETEVRYTSIDGTYLERVSYENKCVDIRARDIPKKVFSTAHIKLASSISKSLMVALGCSAEIPVFIMDSKLYEAVAKDSGIHLSEKIFTDSQFQDEIAFIIAHELFHILLGHNDELPKELDVIKEGELVRNASKKGINFTKENLNDIEKKVNQMEKNRKLLSKKIENETWADYLALDLLAKAGYSLQGVKFVLDRIEHCNGLVIGDFNKNLQNRSNEINQASNMMSYLSSIDSMITEFGAHGPISYRKLMLHSYIKDKYPRQRRKRMNPI